MNFSVLIIILISLISFYLIGSLIILFAKTDSSKDVFLDIFTRLMLGMLLTVFVYAAIKTGANTVLWGAVILGLLYLVNVRHKPLGINRKKLSSVFRLTKDRAYVFSILMILGVSFFFFQGSFFYNQPFNNVPHGDFQFYTTLIEYLNLYGVESTTTARYLIVDSPVSPAPYHYPELWLSALICKLFGTLALETQIIAAHSILASILSIGTIALCRLFTKSKLLQILSIFSILFSGILIYSILPQSETFIFANGFNPKTIMVSLFFLWFVILKTESSDLFYLPLLFLPIVNISLAPATLTTIILFSLISFIFKKANKTLYLKIVAQTFLIAIFIGAYYFLQSGSSASGGFQKSILIDGLLIDKLKPLKIIVGTIAIVISQYFLYLIPTLIIVFSDKRKSYFSNLKQLKDILIYFIISFTVGLVLWSVTHPIADSIQFFYMPALILLNTLALVNLFAVYKTIESQKKHRILFLIYFAIIISVNLFLLKTTPFYKYSSINGTYSKEYVESTVKLLEENDSNNKIIAFISPNNSAKGFWSVISNNGPAIYLNFYKPYYNTINLNILDIPLSSYDQITASRIDNIVQTYSFYKYAKSKKPTFSKQDIPELQYDFIVETKIKYLIFEKGAEINDIFQPIIDTIILDETSKQKFVFLKY